MEGVDLFSKKRHGARDFDVTMDVKRNRPIGAHRNGNASHGPKKCGPFACLVISLAAIVSVLAIIIASVAASGASKHSTQTTYKQTGVLSTSAYTQTLDGGGAALAMTLPNDLLAAGFTYATYTISSRDAAAHTVTITAGTLVTTFDGGFTIATFDGNIGSAMTYAVVEQNRIHVISTFGVTLS
jgi:hypothetical protein